MYLSITTYGLRCARPGTTAEVPREADSRGGSVERVPAPEFKDSGFRFPPSRKVCVSVVAAVVYFVDGLGPPMCSPIPISTEAGNGLCHFIVGYPLQRGLASNVGSHDLSVRRILSNARGHGPRRCMFTFKFRQNKPPLTATDMSRADLRRTGNRE